MKNPLLIAAAIVATATPALANSLIAPGLRTGIADSKLAASPDTEWNRLSRNEGRNVEIWTKDGDALDRVTFFGGIDPGKPLFREFNRKDRPLPKVKVRAIVTDIPALLESSYRTQGAVNQMSIDSQEPATLAGHRAIRFTYSFVRGDDEVRRKGEGVGAMIDGKLYLVTYEAPALHFFDKDIESYRRLAASLTL